MGKSYHLVYSKSNNPCCTVNLYYTTSRMLVNGVAERRFLESHFSPINASIADLLAEHNISLEAANNTMKVYLQQARPPCKSLSKPTSARQHIPDIPPMHNPAILASGDTDQDEHALCP